MFLLTLVFSLGVVSAFGFNDKVISKNQLPAQAQSFLNENFADVKISYAKQETDFIERSYEVVLADGTKLEFTKKGNWKEVDCRYSEVPSAIVPAPIKNFINENYSFFGAGSCDLARKSRSRRPASDDGNVVVGFHRNFSLVY